MRRESERAREREREREREQREMHASSRDNVPSRQMFNFNTHVIRARSAPISPSYNLSRDAETAAAGGCSSPGVSSLRRPINPIRPCIQSPVVAAAVVAATRAHTHGRVSKQLGFESPRMGRFASLLSTVNSSTSTGWMWEQRKEKGFVDLFTGR